MNGCIVLDGQPLTYTTKFYINRNFILRLISCSVFLNEMLEVQNRIVFVSSFENFTAYDCHNIRIIIIPILFLEDGY
jgi:hypothetical protein